MNECSRSRSPARDLADSHLPYRARLSKELSLALAGADIPWRMRVGGKCVGVEAGHRASAVCELAGTKHGQPTNLAYPLERDRAGY